MSIGMEDREFCPEPLDGPDPSPKTPWEIGRDFYRQCRSIDESPFGVLQDAYHDFFRGYFSWSQDNSQHA
jgi:hypothetical protein